MTPGELAESRIVVAERINGRLTDAGKLAHALVDMRAAVHAIHKPYGPNCTECDPSDCADAVQYCEIDEEPWPCEVVAAVEAVWGGDQCGRNHT